VGHPLVVVVCHVGLFANFVCFSSFLLH
ncbi:hypothetical protein CCACVL1_02113, partial [Corchorus capsularis]